LGWLSEAKGARQIGSQDNSLCGHTTDQGLRERADGNRE
jgi:hypothetical protein